MVVVGLLACWWICRLVDVYKTEGENERYIDLGFFGALVLMAIA